MFDRILNTPHFSCNHENSSFRKLAEKTCPNTEFFLVRIVLYSVRIQENTEQKKLRIWTLFTPWWIYRVNCDHYCYFTAQKMKFTIKDFFNICDQIRRWFRVVFRICEKNPLKMLSKMKLLSHKLGWYSFKMFNPDHNILAIYCVSVEYLITTSKTELDN